MRTSARTVPTRPSSYVTWASTGTGAYSLSENGLYTREAFQTFLSRLEPHGILSVSRWYYVDSPGETTRLDVTLHVAEVEVRLVTVDGLPFPHERVHLLRGDVPRYQGQADAHGRVRFFLVEGRRYDVAIEPFDHRVGPVGDPAAWTRLGSFVVGESGQKVPFVVR